MEKIYANAEWTKADDPEPRTNESSKGVPPASHCAFMCVSGVIALSNIYILFFFQITESPRGDFLSVAASYWAC